MFSWGRGGVVSAAGSALASNVGLRLAEAARGCALGGTSAEWGKAAEETPGGPRVFYFPRL